MNEQLSLSEVTQFHRGTGRYRIPLELQSRVCMCEEPGSVLFGDRKPGPYMNCCSTCRKPFRYYIRHCTKCKTWYIKDFRRWYYECSRHGMCFDCIENTEPCGDVTTEPRLPQLDFGPLGLNPKIFTEAELEERGVPVFRL